MIETNSGIHMLGDNSNTNIEANVLTNTINGPDIGLLSAEIHFQQGDKNYPAENYFSQTVSDIVTENSVPFVYWLPNMPIPRTDPINPGSYVEKISDESHSNKCNEEVIVLIDDDILDEWIVKYCELYIYLYGSDVVPINWDEKYREFKILERKLQKHFYYWAWNKGEHDRWIDIEEVLEKLCTSFWKKKLYGHYVMTSDYTKANDVLEEMNQALIGGVDSPFIIRDSERDGVQAFINIQKINLLYLQSDRTYVPTTIEIDYLRATASDTLPEMAYAKGLLYQLTGELVQNDWPYVDGDGIRYRSINANTQNSWSIYPNPASEMLSVGYNEKEKFEGEIIVTNILGSKVYQSMLNLQKGAVIKINTKSFDNGIYILNVIDSNGKDVNTQKVIVNHIR